MALITFAFSIVKNGRYFLVDRMIYFLLSGTEHILFSYSAFNWLCSSGTKIQYIFIVSFFLKHSLSYVSNSNEKTCDFLCAWNLHFSRRKQNKTSKYINCVVSLKTASSSFLHVLNIYNIPYAFRSGTKLSLTEIKAQKQKWLGLYWGLWRELSKYSGTHCRKYTCLYVFP